MAILDYLIVALAAWRVAYALVHEQVFEPLRNRVGVKVVHFDRQWPGGITTQETKAIANNPVGQLLTCVYCTGTWISAGFVLIYSYGGEIGNVLVSIFAISGLVNLVQKWHQRD